MSIEMGKYQNEYYNLDDMEGDSPMSNHKDGDDLPEYLTKLAREGSGWGMKDHIETAKKAASPAHYKDIVPGYEYMDMMCHILGFDGVVAHLKGQIFKYLMRIGKKDIPLQEALKVQWYANYLANVYEMEANGSFPPTPDE